METDYISRKAFIEQKERQYCQNCDRRKNSKGKVVYEIGGPPCRACGIGDMLDDVEDFPAADVRPVIPAQWIALDIYRSEGNYKCSNCGQPCYVPECMGEPMYSVCPNCGADMGGSEDGT